MTKTQQETSSTDNPVATGEHLDNLSRLHRMSRTAGLGTTEYAAVNVAAVMTGVLGLASVMALVDRFFLLIPVVGVVVGIFAIRQIKASSGTQTGLLIALSGLLLCGVFTGVRSYQEYNRWDQIRRDETELKSLINEFGVLLSQDKLDDAYKLLDARMRDRVSRVQFGQFLNERVRPYLGSVKSFQSNGIFDISDAAADTGTRMAQGLAIVISDKLPANTPGRAEVTYRHSSGQWRIFDIKDWFSSANANPDDGPPLPAGPSGPPG